MSGDGTRVDTAKVMRVVGLDKSYGGLRAVDSVSLDVDRGEILALVGDNGAGKSTLIKLLAGELPLQGGERINAKDLKIGYFAQHQLEQLDSQASPLLHLQRLDARATESALRNFLGGFAFAGDVTTSPVAPMSGGEKARLVLAILVYQKPNLLLLDEPTNHLDLEMRQALSVALQAFEGAMIIVSHDRHLLRTVTDQLLLVDNGKVTEFEGDLEDYRRWVNEQSKLDRHSENSTQKNTQTTDKKTQRQNAADRRRKSQPLRNKIQKTEKEMNRLTAEKEKYEQQLADSAIYAEHNKLTLRELIDAQSICEKKLLATEELWIQLTEDLENLDNNDS